MGISLEQDPGYLSLSKLKNSFSLARDESDLVILGRIYELWRLGYFETTKKDSSKMVRYDVKSVENGVDSPSTHNEKKDIDIERDLINKSPNISFEQSMHFLNMIK